MRLFDLVLLVRLLGACLRFKCGAITLYSLESIILHCHKTVLNEKFLITFSTSFKSLLNLNQNFQHKLSRVIQFRNKKI